MIRFLKFGFGGAAALLLATTILHSPARGAEDMHVVPPPTLDVPAATGPQTAVLSGGCFWGVQGVFEHVRGVQHVLAGYSGGEKATADYETVSGGDTGHAESVQITYDPQQISYGKILQIYFSVALDPTMKDAQGPDSGTQYRSELFVANPDQQKVATAYIAQLDASHTYHAPIATRVDPLRGFYPAEAYHQDFLELHPDYPYIVFNDMPKVKALKTLFPADYTPTARTTGTKS
jgi:peptide-methionine (S)-S-oxide reductase